jgi:threonine/homoserine/homoserine lactone efflux protein
MTVASYLAFLGVAAVVVLVPGPDFAVVTRNTLAGGRRRGWATSVGVCTSNAVQGAAAAAGLGALIVGSQPLFEAIKWAGVLYLAYLALQALRSSWRGTYAAATGRDSGAGRGFRQGFLSNITNPKVLVFYLAVLPQFMGSDPRAWQLAVLALTHAVVSMAYLGLLVTAIDRATHVLRRRGVRRALDALTGTALGVFSVRLATEHA